MNLEKLFRRFRGRDIGGARAAAGLSDQAALDLGAAGSPSGPEGGAELVNPLHGRRPLFRS